MSHTARQSFVCGIACIAGTGQLNDKSIALKYVIIIAEESSIILLQK